MEAEITGSVSDETATAAAEKALADTAAEQAAPAAAADPQPTDENTQAQTTVESADQ